MLTIVPDSNVFSDFFNAGALAVLMEASAVTPITVVAEVQAELAKKPEFRKPLQTLLNSSAVSTREILVGTVEHRTYRSLRKHRLIGAAHDAGEHACIAIAMSDPEMIFLTDDKKALFTAARQLQGLPCRIASWPNWLKYVGEKGAKLDRALCSAAAQLFQGRGPESVLLDAWISSLEGP